jgi:hypothetical protein
VIVFPPRQANVKKMKKILKKISIKCCFAKISYCFFMNSGCYYPRWQVKKYVRIFCFAKNRGVERSSRSTAPIPRICLCKSCGISAAIQAAWASNNFAKQNYDQPLAPHGLIFVLNVLTLLYNLEKWRGHPVFPGRVRGFWL